MTERRITFPCGKLSLESVYATPKGEGAFPGVVVCHPHPQYGGSMDNNVVDTICQALGKASIAWLKFNFRGVGGSRGEFGGGVGERGDIAAAISCLWAQKEIDRQRIGLCGYSFGAMVALEVAPLDERVKALALVSPVVSSPGPLVDYVKPKLIMCGSNDGFASVGTLNRIADRLPRPVEFHEVRDADPFWWGFEEKVGSTVADFFARWLK